MKLGVQLAQAGPMATPDAVRASARAAEDLGYASVWVLDRLGDDEQARALDPLTTLAFAAAVTDRVGLGTSVLCVSRHTPAVLARALTSLDVLSRGRLEVGLGTVPSPGELDRLEELLDVLDDPVDLEPVQRPRPPLLLVAGTPAALDLLARRADGWHPVGMPVASLAPTFASIRDAAAAHGRDPDALRLVVRADVRLSSAPVADGERPSYHGTVEQVARDLVATADAGADEVVLGLPPGTGLDAALDAYAALAEAIEDRIGTV